MSYANNDIHGAGPGGNAEPSMEEILASIRRILKEDEPGKAGSSPGAAAKPAAPMPAATIPQAAPAPAAYTPPPVDIDDDVLLLDASMIARPGDYGSATALPVAGPPPGPSPEPLHFSSEPTPFSRDFDLGPRAVPEPVVELPPVIEDHPEPLPPPAEYSAPAAFATAQYTAPPEPAPLADVFAEPEPAAYRPLQPPSMPLPEARLPETPLRDSPLREAPPPVFSVPDFSAPPAYTPPPAPALTPTPAPAPAPAPDPFRFSTAPVFQPPPAPPSAPAPVIAREPKPQAASAAASIPDKFATEPVMNDVPTPDSFEPPESLISDKTTDAAASSIGALVRSMTTEKSVSISKSSTITIEDIVREEIRPLLKSWLDSHLPSLVERIVRSEIERVINRSVV